MTNRYGSMRYNWQNPNWPQFEYDASGFQDLIYGYIREASSLSGGLTQLPDEVQNDALIDIRVQEALKTSEIEGEKIAYEDIRSSIRKELGIFQEHTVKDARAIG